MGWGSGKMHHAEPASAVYGVVQDGMALCVSMGIYFRG